MVHWICNLHYQPDNLCNRSLSNIIRVRGVEERKRWAELTQAESDIPFPLRVLLAPPAFLDTTCPPLLHCLLCSLSWWTRCDKNNTFLGGLGTKTVKTWSISISFTEQVKKHWIGVVVGMAGLLTVMIVAIVYLCSRKHKVDKAKKIKMTFYKE